MSEKPSAMGRARAVTWSAHGWENRCRICLRTADFAADAVSGSMALAGVHQLRGPVWAPVVGPRAVKRRLICRY